MIALLSIHYHSIWCEGSMRLSTTPFKSGEHDKFHLDIFSELSSLFIWSYLVFYSQKYQKFDLRSYFFLNYSHFRFLGFKKTILLDRKLLVNLVDQYNNRSLSWDDFSSIVKEAHANRVGSPKKRVIFPDRPREEDYFYANPYECLQLLDEPLRRFS
jgi:hypothetical protein